MSVLRGTFRLSVALATGLIAFAFVLTGHGTANAYADGCAVVLKTRDGFLNLRKAPRMGSKIVGRLKPGQEIVIAGETMAMEWALVSLSYKSGWASTRFLRSVDCDEGDTKKLRNE
jgi:hypothetical protein